MWHRQVSLTFKMAQDLLFLQKRFKRYLCMIYKTLDQRINLVLYFNRAIMSLCCKTMWEWIQD